MRACVALRRSSTQQISDQFWHLQQRTAWWGRPGRMVHRRTDNDVRCLYGDVHGIHIHSGDGCWPSRRHATSQTAAWRRGRGRDGRPWSHRSCCWLTGRWARRTRDTGRQCQWSCCHMVYVFQVTVTSVIWLIWLLLSVPNWFLTKNNMTLFSQRLPVLYLPSAQLQFVHRIIVIAFLWIKLIASVT